MRVISQKAQGRTNLPAHELPVRALLWRFNGTKKQLLATIQSRIQRADTNNPTQLVNVIKLYRGVCYASNTAKQLIVKANICKGNAVQ